MPSSKAWLGKSRISQKGVKHKGLEVRRKLLVKIRECFVRANICNQSKSLHNDRLVPKGSNCLANNLANWWKSVAKLMQ